MKTGKTNFTAPYTLPVGVSAFLRLVTIDRKIRRLAPLLVEKLESAVAETG
jgi:hypothetical protein